MSNGLLNISHLQYFSIYQDLLCGSSNNLMREPGVFYPHYIDDSKEALRLCQFAVQSKQKVLLLVVIVIITLLSLVIDTLLSAHYEPNIV